MTARASGGMADAASPVEFGRTEAPKHARLIREAGEDTLIVDDGAFEPLHVQQFIPQDPIGIARLQARIRAVIRIRPAVQPVDEDRVADHIRRRPAAQAAVEQSPLRIEIDPRQYGGADRNVTGKHGA